MEKLKNTRILGTIGIVCLILGTIMPYVKFSFFGYSYNISLWGYWEGKVILAITIANLLFIFKDYVEKYIPQVFNYKFGQMIKNANPKFAIIPTVLAAIFAIYLLVTLDINLDYAKYGLGFWILWIGVICLIAHTILYKQKNSSAEQVPSGQSYYNQMNGNIGQTQNVQNNYQQSTVASGTPVTNNNVKFCTNCGTQNDISATTCPACGKQF